MTALASASQDATTSRRRSVHQRSLPSWLPQAWVRSITHRRLAWIGVGTPRMAIWLDHPAVDQDLPTRLVVVAGVQVHHGPGRQRTDRTDGVQSGRQQPIVTVVGRGRHRRQREATGLHGHRALQPLLAPVCRTGPGDLAAAGRLGGAAVHRQLRQLQAEQLVIGGQHLQAESFGHPVLIHSSRRRGRVVAEQVWSAMRR